MKNPQLITQRKLRAKAIADAIVEAASNGTSLKAVGNKLYPDARYPTQTVWNSLQRESVQAETRSRVIEIDDNELKEQILTFIRTDKRDSLKLKALELGMRHKAMLIDKNVSETRQIEPLQDLSSVSSEKLAEELTSRLKLSAQGLEMVKK